MPTLPQFTLSIPALLRHAPFWAQALAVCALFAVAGVAILDDYGVTGDETVHREIAIANADYIATDNTERLYHSDYRYYGVAFDMPLLLLTERALGLQDSRDIYLARHLIMHLFFVVGGFACGMLAYRMIGSRWIALFAMLMFLLHPRLYAHSFFHSRDVPFAALLLIALYLAHRAFRKDTIGAFLLCGIAVGLALNLRPFALMLPPMILVMRAPDILKTSREERKRILITSAAFLAAALAAMYITHPYYWENPLRPIESVRVLSQHPAIIPNLFMGEIYLADAVPWNYIPVWFAITAPPVALLLGIIGCAAVCWQGAARPIAALLDREIRFRILLLGCFALPIAVVIALESNIYHGWRHMHFLWAPFCLLAAVGLDTITNISMGGGIWKIGARLSRRVWLWRALGYGLAGVGLITTLTAMAALHPHQQVYFNALTDTNTPGALGERYDMDYMAVSRLQSLEYLLARYPDDTLRVWRGKTSSLILPASDRERIVFTDRNDADFHFYQQPIYYRGDTPDLPMFHSVQAYGSVIAHTIAPNSDAYLDHYRAEYADVAANGTLLARADFDIYIHNGELRYLNADCAPPANVKSVNIFLHIIPADPGDLPLDRREVGFENLDFVAYGVFFDGKCILRQTLPDYPIARIRTGQNAAASGGAEWRADIDMAAHAAAQALYDGIVAGEYGQPVAQSDFGVYLRGNSLAYLKEPCAAGDVDARFFLHIFPVDLYDLPADSRELGFANLDFQLGDHGARIGDKCVVERELPGYAIERILTGQFVSGEGRVWGAEFAVGR